VEEADLEAMRRLAPQLLSFIDTRMKINRSCVVCFMPETFARPDSVFSFEDVYYT